MVRVRIAELSHFLLLNDGDVEVNLLVMRSQATYTTTTADE